MPGWVGLIGLRWLGCLGPISVCAEFRLPSVSRDGCNVCVGGWVEYVTTMSDLGPSCLKLGCVEFS